MGAADNRILTEATGIKLLRALQALNGDTQHAAATAADAKRLITDATGDDIAEAMSDYLEAIPYQLNNGVGVNHNGIYRGKNLGTINNSNIAAFVAEHKIDEGIFEDLYLGDYFVIQDGTYNVEWMIAAFDWDYGFAYDFSVRYYKITEHSIFLIPRGPGLYQAQANDTDDASGGERRSTIYTELEETIYPVLYAALGDYIHLQFQTMTNCNTTTRVRNNWITTSRLPRLMSYFEAHGPTTGDSGKTDTPGNPRIYASSIGRGLFPVFNYIAPGVTATDDATFWLDAQIQTDNAADDYWLIMRYGSSGMWTKPTNYFYIRPVIAIGGYHTNEEHESTPTRGGAKGGGEVGVGGEYWAEEYEPWDIEPPKAEK